ncbi:MAG: phosphate ABC transporter permease PstA [Armatimonadota bacterium]|nr:phosphate ABC transporter permease PstA [Armatimonadota bacterium]MDW8025458.1 phosphate ABC transporter permease PstA [Armatimonadota bacterium]
MNANRRRFRLPKGSEASGLALTLLSAIATLIVLSMLAIILVDLGSGGYRKLSWEFLTKPPEQGMTGGGIFPAIFGTMFLVIIMTLMVMPVGVLTAIYLNEYAPKHALITRLIRTSISNLAGVPSIVYGMFGLSFFILFLGRRIDSLIGAELLFGQPCLLWAAATLSILTLPVAVTATEEALAAIPEELRLASYALGATKWQTIWRVVFPKAMGGILTGAILTVSRGAAEVAPLLFTGVAYYLPQLPLSPTSQFMHLGYHIYVMATQSPDVEATMPLQYATALVLLALTFLLNLIAILIRVRLRIIAGEV